MIGIEGVITFYGSAFSIEEATVALSSYVLNSSMSYVMVTPITVHFLRSNWGRNSPVVNFFNADEFENNVFMHLADDEDVTRIFEELVVVASSCFFDWGRNSPVVNFFNTDEFENNVLMHLADDEGVTRIFEELIVVVSSCFFETLSDKCVGSVRPPPLPHLPNIFLWEVSAYESLITSPHYDGGTLWMGNGWCGGARSLPASADALASEFNLFST